MKRAPEISALYWRRCALTGALIADDLSLMALLLWQHQHVYNPANWRKMTYHSPLGWRVLRVGFLADVARVAPGKSTPEFDRTL